MSTYIDFVGTPGTNPANWSQSSGNPFTLRSGVSGLPQGFGAASPADDQWMLYTGVAASTGDISGQITQYVQSSGGNSQLLGIAFGNSTYTDGYLFLWNPTTRVAVAYKKTSNVYNGIGSPSSAVGPTVANTELLLMRADLLRSGTFRLKLWKAGTTEPTTWDYTVSPSPDSAAYYAGVRLSTTPTPGILGGTLAGDFYVGTPTETPFTPVSGPTTCTISGPSAGRPGVASTNFTATLNQPATASTVVTPSDGGAGGTFTPSTVTIGIGSTTGTFTYTASSTGAKTITATNNQSLTNVGSLTYTVYSLALAPGSQSVANSIAATLTATLTGGSGALTATTTAGTLSTSAPTSGTPFTLTTPSSGSGTATVTVTGPGGTTATATVGYAPAAATAITWGSYPTAVPVGSASSAFNFAANGSLASSVAVTVTVTPSGGTVTSSPVTLASGVGSTGAFQYTAPSAGSYTVSITNNGGLTNPAPLTITATAVSTLTFDFAAGISGLSTVGYTLFDNATGTLYQARTTSGVSELGTTGIYRVAVSLPKTLDVLCAWDLAASGVAKFAQQYPPRS